MTADLIDPTARSPYVPARGGLFGRRRVRVGLGVLLVLAVGVGAYLLSSSLASSSSPVAATPRLPRGGGGPARGGFGPPSSGGAEARPVAVGTVASKGSSSFTLTSRTGTTVTVEVSGSTAYVGGSGFSALKSGDRVAVIGTSSSATEIDASRVIIGVGGGFGGGRFGGGGGGGPNFGGNGGFGGNGLGGGTPSSSL